MSTDDQQKRGGLVPIGTVAVRLPGIEGARARHVRAVAAPLHHAAPGQSAHRGQRSGTRTWVYGAAARPLLAAPDKPEGPRKAHAPQRAVCPGTHGRRLAGASALRQHPAPALSVGVLGSREDAAAAGSSTATPRF